ncbi:peptidylprolyl isomerase [Vagococcus elongatus]|uniref:Peptidyl-prolyl cis-trans isomerase n=1 Tax=Vagococcus elongatus TaxID=180344 RepID=A0A430B5X9_9ENTE|nr:peptidylprolyl isomerase [Vagococcus elongatus]RSU15697.1 peptidylprolyl isomerase [Vagococcus elongatus]
MKKRVLRILTIGASVLFLTACGTSKDATDDHGKKATKETIETSSEPVDFSNAALPQLDSDVADNEYLVEMVTSMGSIKFRLFPDIVPKTVENFVTHAKDGYYDGVIFHRVIDNFMIQGGDPEGTGMGGESIWGEPFKDESNRELFNIRGALSMANSGPDTNGSQFFIVQNKDDVSTRSGLLKDEFPEPIIEKYKEGGAPYLDYTYEGSASNHTVFGQVFEGMDVVDKIAAVEVDGEKPKNDVKIIEIKILQEPK